MASSRVNVQLNIAAPPKVVFEFLIDLDRHRLWNAGLLNLSKTGKLKQGTTYSITSSLLGRTFDGSNRVTTFVKDRAMGIENQAGPLSYKVLYELAPGPKDFTVLTCRCDISGHMSFFNLAAPLLEYLAQSRLDADLNTLKLLIEHDISASNGATSI